MSAPPASSANPLAMQMNIKQNASELNSYLSDLHSWSTDVKKKDDALKKGELKLTKETKVKPIRGATSEGETAATKSITLSSSNASDQARFAEEKTAGNAAFSIGAYEKALDHYTRCMILSPTDAVSASNRAQTLLKLGRYQEAESDATTALEIDASHVKSLYRRACARKELRKYVGGVQDCEKIIKLEATNKPAAALKKEMEALAKKQQEAKEKASRPIVSAKPVTAAVAAPSSTSSASKSTTAAAGLTTVPGARRMIIQEEDDDDEEDEIVEIKKSSASSTAAPAASSAAKTPSIPPATAPTPVAQAQPAVATPMPLAAAAATSSSSTAAAAAPLTATPPPASVTPLSPSSAATSSSSSSSSTMTAPKSAYDFDIAVRSLRNDPKALADYFRLLPDWRSYATLLRTALDASLLPSIVNMIKDELMPSKDYRMTFTVLHGLSTVPRFNVVRMMMGGSEKEVIRTTFAALHEKCDETGAENEGEIKAVAKLFGVTL